MSGKKSLIAIIDMQNAFVNKFTSGLDKKILEFINNLDPNKICIAQTRYINNENTACYLFEGWKECMEGDISAEIIDSLKNISAQKFTKNKYSCWNNEFKSFIADNNIDKIYFCGVNTGCCVLHSVLDCYNDVMECAVIKDLCASTSGKKYHDAGLLIIESNITKYRVISSLDAISEINNQN